MPIVSVLLPVYNAERTLNEALESLARQSLADIEILVVDDGSTDSSPAILKRWSERDSRFVINSQSHQGIIAALNSGLQSCSANLIARMDADDRADPRRLEKQNQFMQNHPDVAVAGCLIRGFPEKELRQGFRIYIHWLNSLVTHEDITREIFIESPLAHPSVIYWKHWIEKLGGYRENGWAEDYDLWLRLFLQGAKFGKIKEVLLDWREAPQRLTRADSRYSLENFLRAKAYYLARGPIKDRDGVIIWGAGMMGRRLGKQLERQGCTISAFVDIDPQKIGRTRRGKNIIEPKDILDLWRRYSHPILLTAVGSRGARPLIRERLIRMGLKEGSDWLCTA
jgi:glycosyltransferase involved in cell wall biosynthesis